MSESEIQTQCLNLLGVWQRKGFRVSYTRTNAGKAKGFGGHIIHLCDKGWPDITACIDGRFVGIECKAGKNGRPSTSQKKKRKEIEAAGGVYLLIRDPKELNGYLRSIFGDMR